jgi:hypothetical protein
MHQDGVCNQDSEEKSQKLHNLLFVTSTKKDNDVLHLMKQLVYRSRKMGNSNCTGHSCSPPRQHQDLFQKVFVQQHLFWSFQPNKTYELNLSQSVWIMFLQSSEHMYIINMFWCKTNSYTI